MNRRVALGRQLPGPHFRPLVCKAGPLCRRCRRCPLREIHVWAGFRHVTLNEPGHRSKVCIAQNSHSTLSEWQLPHFRSTSPRKESGICAPASKGPGAPPTLRRLPNGCTKDRANNRVAPPAPVRKSLCGLIIGKVSPEINRVFRLPQPDDDCLCCNSLQLLRGQT